MVRNSILLEFRTITEDKLMLSSLSILVLPTNYSRLTINVLIFLTIVIIEWLIIAGKNSLL